MKLSVIVALACLPSLVLAGEVDRAKAFGNPSAPVTIELFSDFQCPSCRALHMQQLPAIMRDYVTPGKVYLVYKEFQEMTDRVKTNRPHLINVVAALTALLALCLLYTSDAADE